MSQDEVPPMSLAGAAQRRLRQHLADFYRPTSAGKMCVRCRVCGGGDPGDHSLCRDLARLSDLGDWAEPAHITIDFARDFTVTPGTRDDGPHSGAAFHQRILGPAIQRGQRVTVDLGGDVEGYPASFLEEAFGGAVREYGTHAVRKVDYIGNDEVAAEIRECVDDADRHFMAKNNEMLARIRAKRQGAKP